MQTIGKAFPERALALPFSSAKRVGNAVTSPAGTECFDILSPSPGDSDVTTHVFWLNSSETKIAARLVWMAAADSELTNAFGIFSSGVSGGETNAQSERRLPSNLPIGSICRAAASQIATA